MASAASLSAVTLQLIDPGLGVAIADPLDRSQDFPHIGSPVIRCAQGDLGLEVEYLVLEEWPHGPSPLVTVKTV